MENTPLVKFIRNYIRDSSGVFSISSLVKISMISLISSVYDCNIFWSFSKVFGNLRKSSESGWKSSENRQKRYHQYVYIIKRTLHVQLEDMNFMFSWQEQHLTHSLGSLVRYCSCHENIKFISAGHCVISSIYFYELCRILTRSNNE